MFTFLVRRLKAKFKAFVDQRMPVERNHYLSHKNIFIFPSWFGVAYIGLVILLFVLGTNYQNNLIIFISFLVVSLFTVVMLHSYSNLAGLKVSSGGTFSGFVGQAIKLPIILSNIKGRRAYSFTIENPVFSTITLDTVKDEAQLALTFSRRGVYQADRIQLLSEFPMGVFRVWTYLKFPITYIVYPEPKPCKINNTKSFKLDESGEFEPRSNWVRGDNFYELSDYQLGEPLSQVAWKQVAKGQPWQVKRYADQVKPNDNILALTDMPGDDIELKLSYLCFLILEFHQANLEFALDLGSKTIESARGEQHLAECLTALARWGQFEGDSNA